MLVTKCQCTVNKCAQCQNFKIYVYKQSWNMFITKAFRTRLQNFEKLNVQ